MRTRHRMHSVVILTGMDVLDYAYWSVSGALNASDLPWFALLLSVNASHCHRCCCLKDVDTQSKASLLVLLCPFYEF